MMVTRRQTPTRAVPRRTTQRATRRGAQPTGRTIITAKREEKFTQDSLQDLDNQISQVVESNITNVANPDAEANKIIRDNITSVDPRFRGFFISKVKEKARQLQNRQKEQINNLQRDISQFKKEQEFLRERRKEARSRGRSTDIFTRRLKEARTKEAEANKIIDRLQKGDRLDPAKVKEFVVAKGAERSSKVKGQQQQVESKKKLDNINAYIRSETLKRRGANTISDIKDTLNVTTKQAKEIQENINKSTAERTEFLDQVKENAILGQDFKDIELRKLGLTNQDIREVRAVSSLESKRINSLLDEFGDNLVPPKTSSYYDKRNTAVLSTLQLDLLEKSIKKKDFDKTKFNKLKKRDQDIITAYNYLKQAKKEIPSSKEIQENVEESRVLSGLRNFDKELKEAKSTREILDIINSASIISKKDKENLKELKNLSDKELRNLLIRGDGKRLNNLIESFNKFVSNENQNATSRVKSAIMDLQKELIRITGVDRKNEVIKAIGKFRIAGNLGKVARLYVLRKKLEKGEGLSKKDYQEFKTILKDPLGLKKNLKDLKAKKTYFKGIRDLSEFLTKVLVETAIILYRDIAFILKGALKGAIIKRDWTKQNRKALFLDTVDAITNVFKKTKDKKALFTRTKSRLKIIADAYNKGVSTAKIFADNPELIALGTATMIVNGQTSIRRTIANNPEKALGEILSFFAFDVLITAGVGATTKIFSKVSKGIKSAKFKGKLSKSLKKNIDQNIIPTDFRVEALRFLDDNPVKGTYLFTDDGFAFIKTAQQKKFKQLALLNPKDIAKVPKSITFPKANKVKIIGKDFSLTIDRTKTKIIQKSLGDFGVKTGQFSNVKIPNFVTPSKQIFVGQTFTLTRITKQKTTQTKIGQDLATLFKSKKGQARLLAIQKSKAKTYVRYFDNEISDLRKASRLLRKSKIKTSIYSGILRDITRMIFALSKLRKLFSSLDKVKMRDKLKKLQKKKAVKKATAKAKAKAKARAKAKAKSKAKLQTKTITKKKRITKPKAKSIKKGTTPRKIRLPKIKLSFRKKPPKDTNYLVNGRVRVDGKIRTIPLNMTLNRALRRMADLVDNSTARSFDIVLIGSTNKKDVKAPASLIKFRKRIGKNPQVLTFVEKARFAIDTPGEKKGLKISKLLKRGKNASKNKNTKKRKSNSKKSSSRKTGTAKKRKVRSKSGRSTKARNKKRSTTSKGTNKKRVPKRKRR